MVSCIKVAHRFGHPTAGAKRITSSPNLVLYISLECRVFVLFSAGLLIVDIYHQKSLTGNSSRNRYNFIFV